MAPHMLGIVCVALLSAFVPLGRAQVSQYGFIQNCPEGCRDIDKRTSCGAVASATSCTMAVNGDVRMACNDGNVYTLTRLGCGNGQPGVIVPAYTSSPWSSTSGSGLSLPTGFVAYIQTHTAGAQTIALDLWNKEAFVRSIIFLVVALLMGVVGIALIANLVLACAIFGFTFFYVGTAFFGATEQWSQFVPLGVGFVGAMLCSLLAGARQGCIPAILGAAFGLVGSITALGLIDIYAPQLDIGVLTPVCSVFGLLVIFSSVAGCLPYAMTALSLSFQGAVLGGFGVTYLWREEGAFDTWIGITVTASMFLVFLSVQTILVIRRKEQNKQRESLARLSVEEDLLNQARREPRPGTVVVGIPLDYGATDSLLRP